MNNNTILVEEDKLITKEITVKEITNAIIDGNTIYYITDELNNKYYTSIKVSNNLPFIKQNDKLIIMYANENDITEITKIK